jgi:hypothetical protein
MRWRGGLAALVMVALVMVALVMVALVTTAGAAGEPGVAEAEAEYPARLASHIGEGRLSQALALGAEAVSRHPDDARLRYLHGLGLCMSLQMDEAAAQLERARELAPGDASIAMALARTHAARGELDRAEAVARQAAAHHRDAAVLAEILATEQRIRQGRKVGLEPAGAARAADRFFAEIAAGGLGSALLRHVAPDAIDRVIHAISGQRDPVSQADRRTFIDSTAAILARAWDNEFGGRDDRYIGYEVQAEEPADSGDVIALGTMLLVKDYGALGASELGQRLARGDAAGVDSESARAYRGLDPAEQNAFLARLSRVRRSIHVPLAVQLGKDQAGAWKVRDVWFGDPPVYVSELAERSWALSGSASGSSSGPASGSAGAPGRRGWYWNLAWTAAKLVGLVLFLAAIIFVLRRKRHR